MALEHFECNITSLKYIDCLMTLHIRIKLIVSQSELVLHGPILLQTTLLVILVKALPSLEIHENKYGTISLLLSV